MQIPNGNAIANLLNLLHTGKERDSETGFSYFGARYYDSDILTGWLSVDPMADKYPSLSPYAYCGWNPVRLVDPDGEEISTHTDENGNVIAVYEDGNLGIYKHSKDEINDFYNGINFSNSTDQCVGATLCISSFEKGDKIDFNSYQARDWMNLFEGAFSHSFANPIVAFASYFTEAGNGGLYDPKSKFTNGSQLSSDVYISPRDLGNFAAGYFAKALGLSKERALASYGAFQLSGNNVSDFLSSYFSLYKTALNFPLSNKIIPNQRTYGEKEISNYFQRLGYENIRTIDSFNKNYHLIWN